jgi:hypothetical protein
VSRSFSQRANEGVSSFVLNDQDNAQQVIQSMDDFSVDYQQSVA